MAKSSVLLHDPEGRPSKNGDGACCISWDRHGNHLLASTSHDLIFFLPWPLSSFPPRLLHHRSSVTSLALSPNGRSLASGSLDHSVKLFSFPDGEFQSNVTRFTLPIRSVAFSPTGALLAAAGEDDGIKLINTIDSSIVRVFKGHSAAVVSLAFDPNIDFLASAGSDGTVMCWCLSSGKRLHTIYHAAPNTDFNNSGRNQIAWHPKGDVLAVPSRKHGVDVVMFDRDTGEKAFSLKGGHSATVGYLAWSPNGKYLATAAGDNQVIVWDVDNRQDFDCQKFDSQICSLAWKPKANALAVINSDGKYGVWDPVIPDHMTLPSDDSSANPLAIDREDLLHFSDDDQQAASEQSDRNSSDRDPQSSPEVDRRRYREGNNRGSKQSPSVKPSEREPPSKSPAAVTGDRRTSPVPELQSPFQPGSTQPDAGKRHFLSYNLVGSVTSCQTEELSHVEVEFHDTGRGVRVPSMTDYFGFTMAAMNEIGSVFASPQKGEKSPSTILYRPFSTWANNSEWSMRLPTEEEVRAVAVGCGWVAAVTSLDLLRLFSEGGLQSAVLSIAGPVVTMAGRGELLAVVTHASSPLMSGQQVMKFILLNVAERTKVLEGPLPLSPGSNLAWLGFSDTGFLSSYDSKGLLRVHCTEYGGCWIPVFSASKELKNEGESMWMVGLNNSQAFCVVCKLPEKQPQVSPKPILGVFNLSLPLVCSDLGAEDLENEFLLGSWHLTQSRQKADEAACKGQEEDQEEDVLKLEANLDRCILRLIAAACKGDKLVKALELTKMLALDKSWRGAIKLVSAMRLPALAERLSAIYEEKILEESLQEPPVRPTEKFGLVHASSPSTTVSVEGMKPSLVPSSVSISKVPAAASPSSLEVPKHASSVEQKLGIERKEANEAKTDPQAVAPKSTDADGIAADVDEPNPSSFSARDSPVRRPSNPFAKSTVAVDGQSGVSILQSLKRMRGTDVETKEIKGASGTRKLKPAKLAKTPS